MHKVSVLALGNWGTALANHLARKGCDVLGWSIQEEVVSSINEHNRHPIFLKTEQLSKNLVATSNLELALKREILVMAFPSSVMAEVVPKMKLKDGSLVISAIKGLDPSSLKTPIEYCEEHLPTKARLAVLSGPSFARDVVAGKPCGIVAASKESADAEEVAKLFYDEAMKVYFTEDTKGVELGGILKNVIALAVGICDGLQLGDSARAGLVTRGLAEITRLACALGANERTLFGLSGLGDLVMTATCDTSRNRTVGLRLGRGEKLDHIIETLGSTAEGVKTAPIVVKLAEKVGVDVPISNRVVSILNSEISIEEAMRTLMQRPIKREFSSPEHE